MINKPPGHSHANKGDLDRVGINNNNKLTIDGVEQSGGGNSHTHPNLATLNKIGESGGIPTFNGAPFGGGSGGVILDNSITARQTRFLNEEILQCYNKATVTTDRLLGASTGVANTYTGAFVTDFIEVVEGQTYRTNLTWSSCYYNASKQFVSAVTFGPVPSGIGNTFTVPVGAKYVRLSSTTNGDLINLGYLSENIYVTSALTYDTRQLTIRSENIRQSLVKALKPSYRGLKYAGIGDSISSPPGAYQKTVCENLSLERVTLFDMSGDRYCVTSGGITGTLFETLQNVVTAADVITFMGGTNDIGNKSPLGTFTDREITTFYGALHKTFKLAMDKFPNAKIGVMSPIQRTVVSRTDMLQYIAIIKEVAEYYNFPFLNLYAESGIVIEKGTDFISTYMPDGTHLNDAGHLIIAKPITRFVEYLLNT
ncbi:SGNH/GDSL hydrolase family protein [Bacillus sp. 3255]|uniref:SGNH/GDSL hydrolase family protein n=1 Tax=Bacillus sp. 3255 TaxID=2817904 RepID=UPI002863A4F8|nr:SGNH/GDSL hydrolase family protein [Bacillus sp. 3255]MDR6883099.1 hypothetical protein [Bacillus sp. 3255]